MSWKTTIFSSPSCHVFTEPNFHEYDEEKTDITVHDRDGDEVTFLLESVEGQAVFDAFYGLQEDGTKKQPEPTVILI